MALKAVRFEDSVEMVQGRELEKRAESHLLRLVTACRRCWVVARIRQNLPVKMPTSRGETCSLEGRVTVEGSTRIDGKFSPIHAR
jgi:hypothetical protein